MAVPVPKEFMPFAGEPVLPYKLWIKLFDNYIHMRDAAQSPLSKFSEEDKNRLLFNLLGLEGVRIFSAQPMSDRMATANHTVVSCCCDGCVPEARQILPSLLRLGKTTARQHGDYTGLSYRPEIINGRL